MDHALPTIDIAPSLDGSDKQKVARQVSAAREGIGLPLIRGQGVAGPVIDDVLNAARRFSALPMATKLPSCSPDPAICRVHQPREGSSPVAADSFVVNIGDLMAQRTNDCWASTLHRVVVPPEADWKKPRYSIVFFHQPNYDALVECLGTTRPSPNAPPRYAPVTSGEHPQRKRSAMSVVKKP